MDRAQTWYYSSLGRNRPFGSVPLMRQKDWKMTIRRSRSIVIIYDAIDRLCGIKCHTPTSSECTIRKMMAAEVLSTDFATAEKELMQSLQAEGRL